LRPRGDNKWVAGFGRSRERRRLGLLTTLYIVPMESTRGAPHIASKLCLQKRCAQRRNDVSTSPTHQSNSGPRLSPKDNNQRQASDASKEGNGVDGRYRRMNFICVDTNLLPCYTIPVVSHRRHCPHTIKGIAPWSSNILHGRGHRPTTNEDSLLQTSYSTD
jgi:hypothetical protein